MSSVLLSDRTDNGRATTHCHFFIVLFSCIIFHSYYLQSAGTSFKALHPPVEIKALLAILSYCCRSIL